MPTLRDENSFLTLGGVRLIDLLANHSTPTSAYDLDGITAEARDLRTAFDDAPHLVAYAVKANSAGAIVRSLASQGCGADVVSGAELQVALGAGVPPHRIVYSGVAKRDDELRLALCVEGQGILAVQLESLEEIARIDAIARSLGLRGQVSIRMNPSVDFDTLDTHAFIATGHDEAKFGVARADMSDALDRVLRSSCLELVGIAVHVGSQFTSTAAYVEAARVAFEVAREARNKGASLRFVDTGGGFGIDYGQGCPVRPCDFVRAARQAQRDAQLDDLALFVEPGRALVAAHGVLLARVLQPKVSGARRWLLVDAGMNDLLRPALYQAHHRVVSLEPVEGPQETWRVAGPVCESSDDFGMHSLPSVPPRAVALLDAGAYSYTMASRYNGRELAPEVFLRGGLVESSTARQPTEHWVEERLRAGLL
ncbi:MAG: diaminopimelate decarboxylase [Myxococcales bacterium]